MTLLVVLALISARSLTIVRNPFNLGMFGYCLIVAPGMLPLGSACCRSAWPNCQ